MKPVALVTGAARGIGAATVRRLTDDGWAVVGFDICADDPALSYALATRADLEAVCADREATAIVGDVRALDDLRRAVDAAVDGYGGLDAAIAAAGVVAGGAAHWETDLDAEHALLDIDLRGVLNLARISVPAMLARPEPRSGRFIAVASAAGARGLDKLAAYCAAKAGVTGFVRALAADLAGTGVTANAVSPGSTATAALDASAALYGLPDTSAFVEQQPIGRLLAPDEVAAAIAWIAGADSSAMTGADVAVDGGLAV